MKNILIFTLIGLGVISCEPEPYDSNYKFVIVNNSNYHVDLYIYSLAYHKN